jgi:hypothetical protein
MLYTVRPGHAFDFCNPSWGQRLRIGGASEPPPAPHPNAWVFEQLAKNDSPKPRDTRASISIVRLLPRPPVMGQPFTRHGRQLAATRAESGRSVWQGANKMAEKAAAAASAAADVAGHAGQAAAAAASKLPHELPSMAHEPPSDPTVPHPDKAKAIHKGRSRSAARPGTSTPARLFLSRRRAAGRQNRRRGTRKAIPLRT